MSAARILLLEDNPHDRELLERTLRVNGVTCEIVHVESEQAFQTVLEKAKADLIISDFSLPSYDGSRAYRKNDNAHCEQKNWTHVRQLFGHERFGHPELVSLMNELYAQEWSQYTNHFKPTFKLRKREKKNGKTKRIYEQQPQTPYQRLLASPDIPEATKAKLRVEHAQLDPFALKKSIEVKLKKFFTALSNLNREATKP